MCEHTGRKHYSRGYCQQCYLKVGRKKLATDCVHKYRLMYARKVCKSCYIKLDANEKSAS